MNKFRMNKTYISHCKQTMESSKKKKWIAAVVVLVVLVIIGGIVAVGVVYVIDKKKKEDAASAGDCQGTACACGYFMNTKGKCVKGQTTGTCKTSTACPTGTACALSSCAPKGDCVAPGAAAKLGQCCSDGGSILSCDSKLYCSKCPAGTSILLQCGSKIQVTHRASGQILSVPPRIEVATQVSLIDPSEETPQTYFCWMKVGQSGVTPCSSSLFDAPAVSGMVCVSIGFMFGSTFSIEHGIEFVVKAASIRFSNNTLRCDYINHYNEALFIAYKSTTSTGAQTEYYLYNYKPGDKASSGFVTACPSTSPTCSSDDATEADFKDVAPKWRLISADTVDFSSTPSVTPSTFLIEEKLDASGDAVYCDANFSVCGTCKAGSIPTGC